MHNYRQARVTDTQYLIYESPRLKTKGKIFQYYRAVS
ncbi:hypothetical protein WP5W18E02_18630 [Aeromonas caviae]|nr:hypothetical protein WP5W18E02_18630 [Aeromonas caviae]